ncbi:MAG TPA: AI-2E family transporter [Vicinamibacterales bacterium]|nr:AI-2E family transporter [Vicinamibacterales bacterium]
MAEVMADDDPRSLIRYAIAMSITAIVVVFAAYLVRDVLLLIYISGLLAIGFSPTVRFIERQTLFPIGAKRYPRWLAILVLYVAILGTLVGIGFLIVPPLADQARQLWNELPAMRDRALQYLASNGIEIDWRSAVTDAPLGGGTDAVGAVFGAAAGVAGGIFGLFTILILTFYLLVEGDDLRNSMLRLFPAGRRPRIAAASRDITIKVSAWLVGQLVLGGIIGGSTAIALWLMGIPFFYVLALIAGVGELIPVVGPILAAIPALAVASTVSLKKALLVLIFFVVQQQVENHVLVPKIMERQVGVSAVTVIVALLIGGKLLGIMGAILAIPTAAILMVVFQEVWGQTKRGQSSPADEA